MKILVADDSLLIRNSMRTILQALGHTAILAIDGTEAVELYKEHRPDMVTLDLAMPRMDGISTLKIIMRIDPYAKVIMSTSNGSQQLVIESIRDGALGYILKPITINKIEEAIKKANNELDDEAQKEPRAVSDAEFEDHLFDDF